ncbi:MAG: hypothetical protein HOP19_22915 [Acidobacteria bacterium]|nr:hypothetical protein [Acidobacteriota bacterium]
MVNPIWVATINASLQKLTKTCPHCHRRGVYPKKSAGQFYTCKHCGHKFKEKATSQK